MGPASGCECSSIDQSKALVTSSASFAGQLHHPLASLHQQLRTTQPGSGRLMERRCRALSIQVCSSDIAAVSSLNLQLACNLYSVTFRQGMPMSWLASKQVECCDYVKPITRHCMQHVSGMWHSYRMATL